MIMTLAFAQLTFLCSIGSRHKVEECGKLGEDFHDQLLHPENDPVQYSAFCSGLCEGFG